MTLPAAPVLDLTTARCPTCDHEAVEVVSDAHPNTRLLELTLHCQRCSLAESLGWATLNSRYLFPWVLKRWGVTL